MLDALFWVFSVPAVAAAMQSLRAGRRYWRAVAHGMDAAPVDWTPPASLIVPVKGFEEGLAENLRSLLEQDYPDFEVLVVAQDSQDPAVERILPLLGDRGRLVVAGAGRGDTGEKINNLLAGVSEARASSEVLVFADSDGKVEPGWLQALIAPLRDANVGAATGYRWYFSERGEAGSLLRTVWNSTIAGTFGVGRPHFAWGGATAIRRETFRAARLPVYWLGAVSDDYRLSEAIQAAGLQIRFTPRAMVASEGECSLREFFGWATRQMIITRVYRPQLWWPGFLSHLFYCGAMTTGVLRIAGGEFWVSPILLLVMLPGMWRGELRRRAAQRMFPNRRAWFDRYGWIYFWLAVPVCWTWLAVFLASGWRRRIEWRGNIYELLGRSRTRPLSAIPRR